MIHKSQFQGETNIFLKPRHTKIVIFLIANMRSMWLSCPSVLPVNGAEWMRCEKFVINKFHSFS